jgi:hypothetical protein
MRSIPSSKICAGISLLLMWVEITYSPGSDSTYYYFTTYYYFNGDGNETEYFPSLPQPAASRYGHLDERN